MKVDVALTAPSLETVPSFVRAAERTGFDAVWSSETRHDPFFPLLLGAEHSQRISLGTAVAIAFPRSPTVMAQIAWDLQAFSRGRFILGLGTQVKAHIERRFGMPWEAPVAKLREYILALRALWRTWQTGERLNVRGRFYKLTLMTDFFNPGPIETPHIPIFIAGVNRGLIRLAGELCEGFHVHPFHSPEYLRQIVLPALREGLERGRRQRADIELASTVFVITGETEAERERNREVVRRQLAFYASTPSYRIVLAIHGWEAVGERLSYLAARKRWDEMPSLITDEMLNTYAVEADWEALPYVLQERYTGLLDRIALYYPFRIEEEEKWTAFVQAFRKGEER